LARESEKVPDVCSQEQLTGDHLPQFLFRGKSVLNMEPVVAATGAFQAAYAATT
jgi:hypothetical protein